MVERDQAEKAGNDTAVRLRQRFPTVEDLPARARRRVRGSASISSTNRRQNV